MQFHTSHHAPVPRPDRPARTPLLVLLAALGIGCVNYACDTRDIRDLDWTDAPRQLGFAADDFVDAFPPRWRAEVLRARNPFGPPALDTMVQDWTWSWEPARDEPVLHRRRRDVDLQNCDLTGWSGEPNMLLLPVGVQGGSDDGAWQYAGRATLAVWDLPSDDVPFPLFWMTEFSDMSEAFIGLTRAPEEFGPQAAEVVGVSEPPPIALRVLGWLGGYGFDLHADAGDGELGPFIGGSPWMTLTVPE